MEEESLKEGKEVGRGTEREGRVVAVSSVGDEWAAKT